MKQRKKKKYHSTFYAFATHIQLMFIKHFTSQNVVGNRLKRRNLIMFSIMCTFKICWCLCFVPTNFCNRFYSFPWGWSWIYESFCIWLIKKLNFHSWKHSWSQDFLNLDFKLGTGAKQVFLENIKLQYHVCLRRLSQTAQQELK